MPFSLSYLFFLFDRRYLLMTSIFFMFLYRLVYRLPTLQSNHTGSGASPPREGNALIQGIAVCSHCGNKMSVQYKVTKDAKYWWYICARTFIGEPYPHQRSLCVNGNIVDDAVSEAIFERLTPEAIKAAEEVLYELEKRKNSEDNYFVMQVEKSIYEAELAKKRYMKSDPENRLVSAELERLWNDRMNQLAKAELELRKSRADSKPNHLKTDIERLHELPEKLQKAWNDNTLCITDKKRIVRNLVEDITLNMLDDEIHIGIRFKGGLMEALKIPRPLRMYEQFKTNPDIVEYIREASKSCTTDQMVEYLNSTGRKSGKGLYFTLKMIQQIQHRYAIPSLNEYFRLKGYLSTEDKAKQMGISPNALNKRRVTGQYDGDYIKTTVRGGYMFEP